MPARQIGTPGRSRYAKRRGQLFAILIMMFCAAALAVGSCFGEFLTELNPRNSPNVFGVVLIASVVVFAVSFVGLLVMIVLSLFERDG